MREVAANPEAALAVACDDKQPVTLVTERGRVPVDFETWEALRLGRSSAGADARWGPTNGPALLAA